MSLKTSVRVPGNIVDIFVGPDKLFVYYEPRLKWWQFWIPMDDIESIKIKTFDISKWPVEDKEFLNDFMENYR